MRAISTWPRIAAHRSTSLLFAFTSAPYWSSYNEELKLALEYNGAQHYKYIPYFHKSKDAFHNQKYRDEIKKYKCKENGIRLIEVPYNVKDIEEFIERELRKLGY